MGTETSKRRYDCKNPLLDEPRRGFFITSGLPTIAISRTRERLEHSSRPPFLDRGQALKGSRIASALPTNRPERRILLSSTAFLPKLGHLFIQVRRPRLRPEILILLSVQQLLGFLQSIMRPVIHVSAIRKTYGSTAAVDDVSFEVNDGEIFGLIGPNGAGKTTTMECIEGLRTPDRGAISVLGLDPFNDVYKLQERIGVQLQQAQLQKRIKVWEAVDLWASLYQRNAIDGERLLEQLGLIEKRNAWFMTLSGGQKQRLFIALALINDPELVFLDELTTGLDPQARRAIWDLVRGIRERGKTVFLTTHLMEAAERLCDRVAIIEHGRIIDIDSPESLVKRHCPERTVVLATDDGSAAERFRAIPRVEAITCRGSQVTIRGSGDDLVTEVIHCLSENRIRVTDFRTILPNLEDVFLKLTGHSIRD
jgi:ABC-2 type transport system ATP-binding protein